MENNGILNWRSWSIIHKAQVIGALVGAAITLLGNIGISVLAQGAGWGPLGPLLVYIQDLTLWPAQTICQRVLGWKWLIAATPVWRGPSWWQMILAIFANAFLLFVIGTCIGWFNQKFRKS
jgi:hypothetical protein